MAYAALGPLDRIGPARGGAFTAALFAFVGRGKVSDLTPLVGTTGSLLGSFLGGAIGHAFGLQYVFLVYAIAFFGLFVLGRTRSQAKLQPALAERLPDGLGGEQAETTCRLWQSSRALASEKASAGVARWTTPGSLCVGLKSPPACRSRYDPAGASLLASASSRF